MPFPRASQALSRFTVLDLTRVRSGPTCVRQLADWGANVIKIETPARLEKGEGPGGPRQGPDFQNLHRNKRSMTLDLKSPQGRAAFLRMVEKADVVVENFRPDVKHRLGIDYERAAQGQQAHRSRQHLRLRPGRALSRPAGLRPDRAGHGRADVDHRPAGPGPGARRHSGRRSLRRPVLRARHPDRAARARGFRRRASGSRPRCCRRRSSCSTSRPRAGCMAHEVAKQAGNNHPTCIPTGVFKTSDGHINIAAAGQVMWERVCEAHRRARADRRSPDFKTGALRSKNRDAVNAEIEAHDRRQDQRRMDRYLQQGRRALRADLFDRPGVRRPAGQASRHRAERASGPTAASRPSSASRSRCRARRARSRRRRRSSASTPTRCSRNSASPTMKSPRCTKPTRFDAMTRE